MKLLKSFLSTWIGKVIIFLSIAAVINHPLYVFVFGIAIGVTFALLMVRYWARMSIELAKLQALVPQSKIEPQTQTQPALAQRPPQSDILHTIEDEPPLIEQPVAETVDSVTLEKATYALKGMGFKAADAKKALARTFQELGPRADMSSIIRKALNILTN